MLAKKCLHDQNDNNLNRSTTGDITTQPAGCTDVQMYECTNVRMYGCTVISLGSYMDVQMKKEPRIKQGSFFIKNVLVIIVFSIFSCSP